MKLRIKFVVVVKLRTANNIFLSPKWKPSTPLTLAYLNHELKYGAHKDRVFNLKHCLPPGGGGRVGGLVGGGGRGVWGGGGFGPPPSPIRAEENVFLSLDVL